MENYARIDFVFEKVATAGDFPYKQKKLNESKAKRDEKHIETFSI